MSTTKQNPAPITGTVYQFPIDLESQIQDTATMIRNTTWRFGSGDADSGFLYDEKTLCDRQKKMVQNVDKKLPDRIRAEMGGHLGLTSILLLQKCQSIGAPTSVITNTAD